MKKLKSLKVIAMIVAVTSLIGLVGCGKKTTSTASATDSKVEVNVAKIKKAGKLVLGTSADYPPYEFHKAVDGKDEVVGFDIEIGKQIAKDLGVELEIKDMKFDGLLAALDAGKVDIIIAGMTPTPEREKNVDFSKVYYKAVQTIVERIADKDKIKSADDLKGMKLGVQKGSVQEDIAKNQIPGAQPVALGKISDLVLSVKENKFAAAIIEEPVAKAYVNANKDLTISDIKLQTEDAGSAVAVKKGSQDLVSEINKTLDRLVSGNLINQYVTDANNLVEK